MENLTKNNSSCAGIAAGNFFTARCLPILMTDAARLRDDFRTTPDIALLTAQMARGDEAAYRNFYELYFNRLLRYLLVLTGNEENAREALQLTLLRVARHAKKFESEAAFWSWLTVLARSSVIDESRKTRRYLSFLDRFFRHSEVESSLAETETDARLLELLEINLSALAPDERALIEKKYFNRDSVSDIAAQLQSSEKAIESRLVRTRRKLKELILIQIKHEK